MKLTSSLGLFYIKTRKTMSASEVNNDGRETMWDIFNRCQRNNHDHQAAVGEFLDNSISWGKADDIAMFIQKYKIIICDNGDFNRERFPEIFAMGAERYTEFYDENDSTQLGKYNCGMTESTMTLGRKCKCMHRFGNDGVRVTKFDIDEVCKNNVISPNDQPVNAKELEMFDEYIKFVHANENKGTLVSVDCINSMNIDDTRKYLFGLYKSYDINITLFDMTRCSPHDIDSAVIHTIEQKDQHFDAEPTKKMNIYAIKTKGDVIFSEKKPDDGKFLYKIYIEIYNFSDCAQTKEKNIFKNSTDEERVGFIWFRGNRRISGTNPLKFGLTTGMNRARGLRIHVHLPVNEHVDDHFKIGTQKKMTNESWGNFDDKLKDKLTEIFSTSIADYDKKIKSRSEQYTKEYRSKIRSVKDIKELEKLEELMKEVECEESQIANKQHNFIKKKAGKNWDALCSYKESIKNRKAEIENAEKCEEKNEPVQTSEVSSQSEEKALPKKKDKAVKGKTDKRENDEPKKVNDIISLIRELNEKEKDILRKKINLNTDLRDLFQFK